MTSTASELRAAGRADLSGRWGESAMLTFVYVTLSGIFSASCGTALDLWVLGLGSGLTTFLLLPMSWSYGVTYLANHRGEDGDPFNISHLFDGYRDFVRVSVTILLQYIFVAIALVLLIVPGIYLALAFALTPYILRDHPELAYNAALKRSMEMMSGHKLRLFVLFLTFIGWVILCFFTLGIGFLWLVPYVNSTLANFYEEVKQEYQQPEAELPTGDVEYAKSSGEYYR